VTRTPLRLTLPVTPRSSREQLRTVLPRNLWRELAPAATGVKPAGPLLLGFHGTGFMDACFAWLAGTGGLPPQKAWRDWCEPPAAMLARAGTAAYPATIQRGRPWGLEIETDRRGLDADGVLPVGSPPWLRKLYLPQHDRFTVVLLELICLAAGWPPLDRQRIKEAGLLVRRLRRGDPGGAEQWEDWIATDARHGRWQLPPQGWEQDLGRDPASRPGLASQPLALAPTTLAGMGKRCVLHGFLSLTSAEQEVPESPPPVDTRAAAAQALGNLAQARLDALITAPSSRWQPRLELLLGPPMIPGLLTDTVLPAAPGAPDINRAGNQLRADFLANPWPGMNPADIPGVDAVDVLLEQALLVLIERVFETTSPPPRNLFDSDTAGSVISGSVLWSQGVLAGQGTSVVADGLQALRNALQNPGAALPSPLTPALGIGDPDDWDVFVRNRLDRLLRFWITGQSLPVSDQIRLTRLQDHLLPALLAAALVRARGCRLALAAAMNTSQVIPQDLLAREPGPAPPLRILTRSLHSLADLGEGLESFLAIEEERGSGGGLVPWGDYTPPADDVRLKRVDRSLRELAAHYEPFEAQLAEAGAQVRFELRQRADALETAMGLALNTLRQAINHQAASPGMPSLLEWGLDLLEPPAAGLLLLPGLGVGVPARLADFTADVATRYVQAGGSGGEAVAEALVAAQLRRPRFDAHHIYAVQAWVRVSGRIPEEAERLIWSPRSEPFVLAEPMDLLGSQPQAVPLPDLPRLLRDLTRLRKTGANPFLTLVPPPRSGAEGGGGGLESLRRDWGMGTPVALVAPVLAIAGLGLLTSALRTLSRLPGFAWVRQVVVRSPAPERRP
jgi:hypothetical protein